MKLVSGRGAMVVLSMTAAILFAGCSSKPISKAPVEDKSKGVAAPVTAPPPVANDPVPSTQRPAAAVETNARPATYTVKAGDSLIRIGMETGQNWRDIARWNGIENPNLIEVGQVLRVLPPQSVAPVANAAVVTRPVVPATVAASSVASPTQSAGSVTVVAPAAAPAPAASAAAPSASGASAEDDVVWIWPARGVVLAGFDEVKNKGLDIGGAAGEPVLAAADGRVVYVGASLRGYGNLIILKHNNTYLTAYAHNQSLLVKEDQNVSKGQKIAEMGSSDADRVKLHFEVRRQGRPVDPAKYLPPR